MTIRDIMNAMETIAPQDLAEQWDNVGLLVGDPAVLVDTVVLTLDITNEAVAFAKDVHAQMIIAHHPLIFSPVKRMVGPSPLLTLASSGIAAFAAHTNLDAVSGGVNDALADVLGLTGVQPDFGGLGRVGRLPQTMTPSAFAAFVGERLHTSVQVHEGCTPIETVALVSGAGGEFAYEAQADAFVTGEIKHHEWLAVPSPLTVIAAGHYATENIVLEPLSAALAEQLPTLNIHEYHGTAPYRTLG